MATREQHTPVSERLKWAQKYIPELKVTQMGGFFPYQAEGTLGEHSFYLRSEQGSCSILVGNSSKGTPYLMDESFWSASLDDFEVSNDDSFVEAMILLVQQLKPSMFLWEFAGHKINYGKSGWVWSVDTNESEKVLGWGHTPEEGYIYAQNCSQYLADNGFTFENQKKVFEAREVSPVPLNQDMRNIPELPVFVVHLPEE